MSDVRTTAPGPEEGPDGRPALCLEDFRAVDWRGVTSSAPFRGLRELADRFRDRAQQALSADDRRGSAVYQSLADVCSLVLREDRHDDPFMPFMVTQAFNKRTAFLAMAIFLGLNGYELEATQEDVVTIMVAAAAGKLTESQLAAWVRDHLVKLAV
jgi:hypothetical protein